MILDKQIVKEKEKQMKTLEKQYIEYKYLYSFHSPFLLFLQDMMSREMMRSSDVRKEYVIQNIGELYERRSQKEITVYHI